MGILGRIGGGLAGLAIGTAYGNSIMGGLAGIQAGGAIGDQLAKRFGGIHGADAVARSMRAEYKLAKHMFNPRDWQPNPRGPTEHLNTPRPRRPRGGGH
jgi:hypothetical protein